MINYFLTLRNTLSVPSNCSFFSYYADLVLATSPTGIRDYSVTYPSYNLSQQAITDDGFSYKDVWTDGYFVYTACGTSGVRLYLLNGASFDLSDSRNDGGDAQSVWSDYSYIYVACGSAGIRVYSYDYTLTLLCTLSEGITAQHIAGDYSGNIFVACGSDGLRVYNFDGANLSYVTSVTGIGTVRAVSAEYDNYVHVACGEGGIRTYDFNGASLTLKASTPTSGNAVDIVDDRTDTGSPISLFVLLENQGLYSYEFLISSHVFLDSVDISNARSIACAHYSFSSTIAVSCSDTLLIYSSDPDVFGFVDTGSYPTLDWDVFTGVWYGSPYLYAVRTTAGIYALNFTGSAITLRTIYNDGQDYRTIFGSGGFIFTGTYHGVLNALTYNGTGFIQVNQISVGGDAIIGLWADSSYIYTCNDQGLSIYTFNGSNFSFVARRSVEGAVYRVWGDGTYLYTVNGNGHTLRAYTFSGGVFTLIASIDTSLHDPYVYTESYGVWGDGTYIYVSGNTSTKAYSFNGVSFTYLAVTDDSYGGNYVWTDNTFVYVAKSTYGVRAYIFDGASFLCVAYSSVSDSQQVFGYGDYIFSIATRGVYSFNVLSPFFVGTPLSGNITLTTNFTDQSVSKSTITGWSWTFGDSHTSLQQNPSNDYSSVGSYDVSLSVTNAHGTNTRLKKKYVTASTVSLQADFTSDVTSGPLPLTVNFTDTSIGSVSSWAWDFGDGATSTDQNPSHTYAQAGTYTVQLTVYSGPTSDTVVKTDYITVTVTASFSADILRGYMPLSVHYTSASGPVDSWLWDFGDGGTSTTENPTHVYLYAGIYTVRLTVQSGTVTDTATRIEYIVVDYVASRLMPQYINVIQPSEIVGFTRPRGPSLIFD